MTWSAQWIWHPPLDDMDNFYMLARRGVGLDAVPASACVMVTAGSLYKLYINGRFVGRGPNPSDPSRYYFDVYDIASFLQPGLNVVAAVCYNYGAEAKGILGQNWGRGGFLLEMRSQREGQPILVTDASWRVLQAPEWDQKASINCTLYGDYKETYDSRREIEGWQTGSFDDSPWLIPEVLGPPPVEPYTQLVEREIPFLSGEPVYPGNVYRESASVTYAWRDDWEIYHQQRLIPESPFTSARSTFVEVTRTHDDFAPSILLDYGRDVTGYPEIVIRHSKGGIIDVLYGEDLNLVRVDRFILKGGPQVLQAFNRRTFRYMKLLFSEAPEQIGIDAVSLVMNTYPVSYRGRFACSDELLNRVWEVSRYTIHMSMLDHFVDCPWRERTIYGGDIYAENLFAHYAFGDPRMNRKVLRQMFAIQHSEGALPPYGPYRGCDGFYPSWSGFTGLALLDDYQFTGDRDFLESMWPGLVSLLEWAIREIEGNTPPLIGNPAEGGRFEAWSRGRKVRFGAWDNVPFLLLFQGASRAAGDLGRARESTRYADVATALSGAISEVLIRADGLCCTVPPTDAPAQGDGAYLLWGGSLGRAAATALATRLFEPGLDPIPTPFIGLFMVEGLFRYHMDDQALAFIREYWGDMLSRGATTCWEHFALGWPEGLVSNSSLCHGWSACPVYSLPAHVLGVRPLEPGFSKVLIEPQLGDLAWAEGEVPTQHGTIHVRWSKEGETLRLLVELPPGCSGRVVLPKAGGQPIVLNGQVYGPSSGLDVSPGVHTIAAVVAS